MNQFRKDPDLLLRYCQNSLLLFMVLNGALLMLKGVDFEFDFRPSDAFFILLPLIFCGLPSSIMHNCAHKNIRPLLLNNVVGEVCGTFMLYGFKGFALAHMFHHLHPDDPLMDPHPPQGKKFLPFVISPIKSTLLVVERAYYGYHGRTDASVANIRKQVILFNLCLAARTAFWFLLLGPKYFLLAYLPTYFANIFVFAHINFAAHRECADGTSEILNLNHNIYYKYINQVSFGGYFHKSHHLRPGVFNPATVTIDEKKRLVTNVPLEGKAG